MVEKIKPKETLRETYPKLNQMIDIANKAGIDSSEALSTANTALANSEDTQTQLDTIVIKGDSSVEAAQARVSHTGTTYTTLKERLDSEYNKVTADLAQTTQELNENKMDKDTDDISINQINKSKGLIDETFIADSLKQQIAGEAGISGVVPNGSITESKLANAYLPGRKSKNLYNPATRIIGKAVNADTGELFEHSDFDASDFVPIISGSKLAKTNNQPYAFYDDNYKYIDGDTSGYFLDAPSNAAYIRITVPKNATTSQLEYGDANTEFEPYGTKVDTSIFKKKFNDEHIQEGSLTSTLLSKGAASFNKRTELGSIAFYMMSSNTDLPIIDVGARTVTFKGTFHLHYGRWTRIFTEDVTVALPVATRHAITFDLNINEFKVHAGSSITNMDENEILVMALNWNSNAMTSLTSAFFTNEYNVIGAQKQLPKGDIGLVTTGVSGRLPNVNTVNKTVTYYENTAIGYKGVRYNIPNDVVVDIADSQSALGLVRNYIVYDIETGQFRMLKSSYESFIKSTEVIVTLLNWDSNQQNELLSIYSTISHTIDGESQQSGGIAVGSKYNFAPYSHEYYYPNDNYSYDDFSWHADGLNTYPYTGMTTVQEMQSAFDQLTVDYPHFITRKLWGYDSSNTYPIYEYILKGRQVPGLSARAKPLPKGLITGCLHGSEKDSVFSLYYFMKDICERWEEDANLEFLRWHFDLRIIPIANPYGFQHTGRVNSNGVDLNRNFPAGFVVTEEGTSTWSGHEPLSEAESQIINDWWTENEDAMFYIDYHTNNGSGLVFDQLTFYGIVDVGKHYFPQLETAAQYTLSKTTREFINRYDEPQTTDFAGFMRRSSSFNVGTARFTAAEKGIDSGLVECMRKLTNHAEYHTAPAIKACTELIGNYIFAAIDLYANG